MSLLFESTEEDYAAFPQADQNRVLQELSLRAFRRMLPAAEFVVRDERIEDAGVDASVELLLGGAFTNFRAQTQLKSTQTRRDNNDGSVSLSVPVSNLKYLLNGQCPLYVLYVVDRDELRLAWARDERRRIDAVNPDWEAQQEITLRFTERFQPVHLESLKERIEKEGRLQREIHATLSQATVGERVTVCIDSDSLRSTDPRRILNLLLEQGISLVNDGKANEVIDAVDVLNPNDVRQPRIQLIVAYARYLQSQFQDAVAALVRVLIGQAQLSSNDQQFAAYLRDACEYHLGRLSFDEFLERQMQRQGEEGTSWGTGFRLVELRHRLLLHTEVEPRRAYVREIEDEVVRVNQSADNSRVLKTQAVLFLIYAEGTQLAMEEYERWGKIGMRLRMSQASDVLGATVQTDAGWQRWEIMARAAFREAEQLKHPLLLADLHLTRGSIALIRLTNVHLIANMFGNTEPPIGEDGLKMVRDEAEKAVFFYERTGQFEGQLQARLLGADTFALEGRTDDARSTAREVLPIAQAMQYAAVEAHATALLTGKTLIEQSRTLVEEARTIDEDERMAGESDERMRLFAREQLVNLELPADRLPMLERAACGMRDVARERLNWCRHIDVIEDLTHMQSPLTMYITNPEQFGICNLIGYRASVGSEDWSAALNVFKDCYCRACPYRQAKRTQS